MSEKNINIVLTGGHAATTAIATVQEIRGRNFPWNISWIGAKNAIEGTKMTTLESEALPKLGVKFFALTTGRMQRRFSIWTIPSILRIPVGFIGAIYYLLKIKPKVVLSFGGFASFPVVVLSKFLRIPVVVHEQTIAAGRANKLSIKYATRLALSKEESLKYFPEAKSTITGNPVMKEISKIKIKTKLSKPPVIFITGGSRGSQSINDIAETILRPLLSKYKVIHQTGGLDYLKFSDLKQKLPQALKNNYEVFPRINPLEISKIYEKSDIVVSRAGANTVSELMMIKRPAILIPLPISYLDEQTKNAEFAKKWGIAQIINQKDLTSENLSKKIENIIENYNGLIAKVRLKESPDKFAAKKLVDLVADQIK